ncbi:hypothetical protein SGPA1_20791 [Streptomyces misionensis JCM 4497]
MLDDRADLLPRLTGIPREAPGSVGDMRTHLADQRRSDHLSYLQGRSEALDLSETARPRRGLVGPPRHWLRAPTASNAGIVELRLSALEHTGQGHRDDARASPHAKRAARKPPLRIRSYPFTRPSALAAPSTLPGRAMRTRRDTRPV